MYYSIATVKAKFVVTDPGLLRGLKIIKSKKRKNTSVIRALPQVFGIFFYFMSFSKMSKPESSTAITLLR